MNRLTLVFNSIDFETQYQNLYIPSQVRVHQVDTIVSIVLFGVYMVQYFFQGQFLSSAINLMLAILKLAQHYYICKRNQKYVGISLSISNLMIGILDATIFVPSKQGNIELYFQSVTVTIYHICLLITPNFLLNLVTFITIVICKCILLNISHFTFETLGVISSAVFFISILYERTLEQKQHFISLIKENISDEILQNQLYDSILVMIYDPDSISFKLHKCNKVFETTFGVKSTSDMNTILKEALEFNQKISLQLYLHQAITCLPNELTLRILCQFKKESYFVDIKYYQLNEQRFVLSFQQVNSIEKNQILERKNQNLQQILVTLSVKAISLLNNLKLLDQPQKINNFQNLKVLKLLNYILNVNVMLRQITGIKRIKKIRVGDLLQRIFPQTPSNCGLSPKLISLEPCHYLRQHLFILNHIFLSLYFYYSDRGGQIEVTLEKVDENVIKFSLEVNKKYYNTDVRENSNSFDVFNLTESLLGFIGPYNQIEHDEKTASFFIYQNVKVLKVEGVK